MRFIVSGSSPCGKSALKALTVGPIDLVVALAVGLINSRDRLVGRSVEIWLITLQSFELR